MSVFTRVYEAELSAWLADYSLGVELVRIYGITLAANGLFFWLLSRYGIRELFVPAKPWRLGLMALALTGMMQDGEISRARALELARMVLRGNAEKLYGLK